MSIERKATGNLTLKQQRVLGVLRRYVEEHGTAPTLDELAHLCRVSKSTIRQYLAALEEKGYIRRSRYAHRSIELVGGVEGKGLPIVGWVAAGTPILAVENIDGYVDRGELFKNADFMLRVQGDSMKNAGILDGDLVAVHRQPEVQNGEIGVVVVEGEATVKRVFVKKRGIRLIAENPAFEPMEFDAADGDIRIVGKVAGVIRKM